MTSSTTSTPPVVQAKLTVSEPGDAFEREADAISERVMRMPAHAGIGDDKGLRTSPGGLTIQRKCTACEDKEMVVAREADEGAPAGGETNGSSLESSLEGSKGSGASLPRALRDEMGDKLGTDFDDVRVHTDRRAVQLSRSLGAQAFTHGSNIYFDEGRFDPGTYAGKKLLTHELTHVVQQTSRVQTFRPPAIQKFEPHEEIQKKLRAENSDMITEAPIPGATTPGMGPTHLGYADIYKSTGSVIAGIKGAKYRKEVDETTKVEPEKMAYEELTEANSIKHPKGRFTRSPTLPTSPVSVIREGTTAKYFKKLVEVPESTKASLMTGGFPTDFFVADIKRSSDSIPAAEQQLRNYRDGFRLFSERANRDFGVTAAKPGELYKNVRIPVGLDYSEFEAQNATLGAGNLTETKGRGLRRYWLYPYRDKGLYIYIMLPHPWSTAMADFERKAKAVVDELNLVNKGLQVTQTKPSKTLGTKRARPKPRLQDELPTVQLRDKAPVARRKTDWKALRKAYMSQRAEWIKKHAKGYLKDKDVDEFLEKKVDFDKKVKIPSAKQGKSAKVGKQFRKIDFWASTKGKVLGELRFVLGDNFDVLADKFQSIKERTKKARDKAGKLSGSKIKMSFGWKRRLIELLIEGFKTGFKIFIEETYAVFARCIEGMIQRFQDSFADLELFEELKAQIEGIQTQVESLIATITTEYEEQIKLVEAILEKMKDFAYYAGILANAETLIRLGVQVISCVSPPALGCLWGLVAQVGMEVGLDLIVGSDWFENRIVRPKVKDLIDEFLKDDILKFMNGLFAKVGLADYAKGVPACQVTAAPKSGSGWYSGTPSFYASDYKARATAWEAKNKDELLQEVTDAFSGGTSGRTVTKADVEKLIADAKSKGTTIEDFKKAVESGKKGEGKYDIKPVEGAVGAVSGTTAKDKGTSAPTDEDSGDTGVTVIDAKKVGSDKQEQGTTAANVRGWVDAHTSHTKGTKLNVTIWIFEDGEHLSTVVNVPAEVVKRQWWPSEQDKQKLLISYRIDKHVPLHGPYFIQNGNVLPGQAKP